MVTKYLIDAQVDHESIRAIERLLNVKVSKTFYPKIRSPCMEIYVYSKIPKQNEANEWIESKIIDVDQHNIICKKKSKCPPMEFIYDDGRLIASGDLTIGPMII